MTSCRDSSGVAPAMDLALEGPELMNSYGIRVASGRAIATAEASRKLYDRIGSAETGSQAYSLELWVANANTTQEGPARIIRLDWTGLAWRCSRCSPSGLRRSSSAW